MTILKKREIDAIVTVAFDTGSTRVLMLDFDKSTVDMPDLQWILFDQNQLGQWLYQANVASHLSRNAIPDADPSDPKYAMLQDYVWERNDTVQDPITLLALLGHYIYESCADPRWWFSDQREWCNQMLAWAVQLIPGYSEASWE